MFLNLLTLDGLIKIGILILLFLYLVFAFVVLNQVRAMNGIIKELHSSTFVFWISLLHFIFALSLFIVSLVIL